jgi:hypothetical protein
MVQLMMTTGMTIKSLYPRALFATLLLSLTLSLGCGKGGEAPHLDGALTASLQRSEPYLPFQVASRIEVLETGDFYPCSDCHDDQVSNPKIRELEEEHDDIATEHGGGRFWCLTCHHPEDKDTLINMKGEVVSFDESFQLCGQCHYKNERDFYTGAHGKRTGSWQADRTLTTCVECHDPHSPSIKQRKALSPPPVRTGLSLQHKEGHAHEAPWDKILHSRMKTYGAAFFQTPQSSKKTEQ